MSKAGIVVEEAPRDASDDEQDIGDEALLESIDELYSQMLSNNGTGACVTSNAEHAMTDKQNLDVLEAALMKTSDDVEVSSSEHTDPEELEEQQQQHEQEVVEEKRDTQDHDTNELPVTETEVPREDLRELLQETLWSALLIARGAGDQLDVEARLLKLLPPPVLSHCLKAATLPGSLRRQVATALPGLHAALEAAEQLPEDGRVVPAERLAAVVRVARDYLLKMACLPDVAAKALEAPPSEPAAAEEQPPEQAAAKAAELPPLNRSPQILGSSGSSRTLRPRGKARR